MKKITIFLLIGIAAVAIYLAVDNKPAQQEQNTTPEQPAEAAEAVAIPDGEYALAGEQTVSWEGTKPRVTNYVDSGTLAISDGTLSVASAETTGEIVFDMTSIAAENTGRGSGAEQLTGHLKSDDFFAVETYPEATFTLTQLTELPDTAEANYTANGELTMKGTTEPVSFPVLVSVAEDGTVQVSGDISLDRTRWDVRYGSDKFFDNLADNVISDMFTVSFEVPFRPVSE